MAQGQQKKSDCFDSIKQRAKRYFAKILLVFIRFGIRVIAIDEYSINEECQK